MIEATAAVPSPCVKLCVLDPATQRCLGCWRDLDEIAAWGSLDEEAKRAILLRLDERRAAVSQEGAARQDSAQEAAAREGDRHEAARHEAAQHEVASRPDR